MNGIISFYRIHLYVYYLHSNMFITGYKPLSLSFSSIMKLEKANDFWNTLYKLIIRALSVNSLEQNVCYKQLSWKKVYSSDFKSI